MNGEKAENQVENKAGKPIVPTLEMEGMSLSKRKLMAAKVQDKSIIDDENKQCVRKLSENLVNAAFMEVAREIYLNPPRK